MPAGEAAEFLRALSVVRPPALILSGGEPLCHENFHCYLRQAAELGLNVVISTNGSMIDERSASMISGFASYAGISLDGPEKLHDEFRGVSGAFKASVRAINALVSSGCRTGLRVTLARPAAERLDETLEVLESLPVSRVCFYHFIPSGRGALDVSLMPEAVDERAALRRITEWVWSVGSRVYGKYFPEVLTVGDASDSVAVYEYMTGRGGIGGDTLGLMSAASGRMCGAGILSVRWDGTVFPNQFIWTEPLGNWRDLPDIAARVRRDMAPAAECSSCVWKTRRICASRMSGFGRCSYRLSGGIVS
jgi:MoaA/NifB/PqqE/SkfB family radical SAM enzyme